MTRYGAVWLRNKRRSAFVLHYRMYRSLRLAASLSLLAALIGGCSMPPRDFTADLSSSMGRTTVAAHNSRPDGLSISLRVKGQPGEKWRVYFPGVTARQILLANLNGKPHVIVLLARGGVRIYKVESDGLRELWAGLERLNPWKIQAADVDADGKVEIGIGVYKKARFHPVMAKRPFIYGWDGKQLYPEWLGSRLSRPFTDFVLADFGKAGTKLVAIEETKDGEHELAVYRWDGFGFTREWSGARSEKLSELTACGPGGKQMIKVRAGHSSYTYIWNGKALQEWEDHP